MIVDRAVAALVPRLPRRAVRTVASRYISGETLESAMRVTKELNALGMTTTLDVLGENVADAGEADATVTLYGRVLEELARQELRGNISVKPTHLGLRLDQERCFENIRSLVRRAAALDNFVRIDMEDSGTTTATLDIHRRLRETGDNVGVVLQAYLRRSEEDASTLARMRARVRVCKGIYREPPAIAFQDPGEINASFLRLVEHLLSAGCRVAIATHDPALVQGSYRILEKLGGCEGRYEFQMLLGVAEELRGSIVAAGHPLRVYVPFGEQWYEYSMRRLRENPRIAGHVFRALIGLS
jgi:proline dehydrogenase